MRVAIDARIAQGERAGLSVHVLNLINALVNQEAISSLILLTSGLLPPLLVERNSKVQEITTAPPLDGRFHRDYWEQITLPSLLEELTVDVYHGPVYSIPFIRSLPCASVVTFADASILANPKWYPFLGRKRLTFLMRRSANAATRIICDSRHAREECIRYLGPNIDRKISSISIALPMELEKMGIPSLDEVESIKRHFAGGKKYFFALGTIQPRKNYERLIEAFAKVEDKDTLLLICGSAGWKCEEIYSAPNRYGVKDRVKFLGGLPTKEMRSLMRGAVGFIFPSLYEGFGLPLLEAFSLGTPVGTSSSSSIPEVVGDAALMFNPESTVEITAAMNQLINEPELSMDLVTKGYLRLKSYSWDRCAFEHVEIYKNALTEWQKSVT